MWMTEKRQDKRINGQMTGHRMKDPTARAAGRTRLRFVDLSCSYCSRCGYTAWSLGAEFGNDFIVASVHSCNIFPPVKKKTQRHSCFQPLFRGNRVCISCSLSSETQTIQLQVLTLDQDFSSLLDNSTLDCKPVLTSPPLAIPGSLGSWPVSREAQPTTSATSSPRWSLTNLPAPSSTSSPR